MGGLTLTVRGKPDADFPNLVRPLVVVEAPGKTSQLLTGEAARPSLTHTLGFRKLDSQGERFVLFQSSSGGAHCCNNIQAAIVSNAGVKALSLGSWDGDYITEFPRDVDGDGTVDFTRYDNDFLYAFASYAESDAPPVILNIVRGKAVDVSAKPQFAHLFAKHAAQSRRRCLNPRGKSPNGACAAYVASAARSGGFEPAWREMLKAFDPRSSWELPTRCAVAIRSGTCPPAAQRKSRSYPDALRWFLQEQGYLPR
jgi:hypothetical protein